MFSFENPAAFLLLLLIPILILLRKFGIFKKITFKAVLSDWEGKQFEWNRKLRKFLSVVAKVLLGAGFVAGVAALADPVVSTQEKIYTNLGAEVIFVVDTSPSMAAKDVDSGTRLNAAKDAIKSIVKSHDGYRYGIVGLGSNASVIVPPTNDLATFTKRIDEVQIGQFGNGSAIGDGLSTAVCHLASSTSPKKCIILLTDGENNAGEIHPETAADLAARNNIALFIVGIGSKGTVPIEYTDPATGKLYSGYLDSDFNPASLKKLTTIADGKYFESRTVTELGATLEAVAKIQTVSQNFTYRTEKIRYYNTFILAAIIFMVTAWIIKRIVLREMINFHFKKLLIVRSVLLGFAFIMLIIAYHGLTWGTYLVPVQKNGTAVSFVFDISNSMLTEDCAGDNSRLESARLYAKKLLTKMEGTSVSVVLAKGDGITAIPVTEDKALIESLLDVMNPSLMTAPGSSLGKGLLKAKESFPKNYSSAGRIWLFTDGEETDGLLTSSMVECVNAGIPVTIVGFGSYEASNILAGDGKTEVQTALREHDIQEAIYDAERKVRIFQNKTPLQYINSTERGSALKLLSQLNPKDADTQIVSYEARPINHYKLFLVLALLALAFSFITTEFNFARFFDDVKKQQKKKSKNKKAAVGLCVFATLFTGCSNTHSILQGMVSYKQKQYRHAVSYFLDVVEDAKKDENLMAYSYALYDLGTAYQMLGETEAALEKFALIPADAPSAIKYSAFYNAGIISQANSNYEEAQNFFRKALEVDNSKIDAKINMELSLQMAEEAARQNQSATTPVSENKSEIPDMDKALFKHIKENDQKQWKNSETTQSQNLANDY